MTTRGLLFAAVLLIAGGRGGWAQTVNVSVTPNPVPLDGTLTVHISGLQPNAPADIGWDEVSPGWGRGKILGAASPLPTSDANGNLVYSIDRLPTRVFPAKAGDHVLTVSYFPPFSGTDPPKNPNTGGFDAYVQTPVTVLPRANWPAAAPFPTQTSPKLSGGLLAFLNYSPDHSSTSIALSDGTTTKTWGTLSTSGEVVGPPSWSPDGSQLAFPAVADTQPDSNLYVLDRAGHLSQVTAYNGAPPHFTGGGVGSLAGSVLPFVDTHTYHFADPGGEFCEDLINNNTNPPTFVPRYPMVVYVNVVGTGIKSVVALPAGGKDGDPFPFHFDNLPEGDYSVNMSYTTPTCYEHTIINPFSGQPNQPATLLVHDPVEAVPNVTLPVHVTAGQLAQMPPSQLADFYTTMNSPSWQDGGTLLYSLTTGVSFGIGSVDLWSLPLGGAPAQLTSSSIGTKPTPFPQVRNPDVSPLTKRVVSVSESLESGLFAASAADVTGSTTTVTSPPAIKNYTDFKLFVSDDHPAWSPDGFSYVAFIRTDLPTGAQPPSPGSDPISQANALTGGVLGDLWFTSVSTGAEAGTGLKLTQGEGYFGRPAWSPDGSQIALSYTPDNFKTVNVRIVNLADGSAFDLTTDGRSAFPTWTGQGTVAQFPTGVAITPPGAFAVPTLILGDVNGDTHVDVSDAVMALQAVVQQIQLSPAQVQAADVNKDKAVDVRDAVKILRVAVKLDPGF